MKYVLYSMLIVLLATTPAAAKSKEPPFPKDEDGRYHLQEVVQVDGVSADELYSRARLWVAEAWKSAPDVTKYDEENRVIIKGLITAKYTVGTKDVRVTTRIETRDGRYRVAFSDFLVVFPGYGDYAIEKKGYGKTAKDLRRQLDGILIDLEAAMRRDVEAEEW